MTTRELDFDAYAENVATMNKLHPEIERLEGFAERTTAQKRRLSTLQGSYRVLDEQRKNHERQCLVAGISFDGTERLESVPGHTARDLDDDLFGD